MAILYDHKYQTFLASVGIFFFVIRDSSVSRNAVVLDNRELSDDQFNGLMSEGITNHFIQ